jgi:hypothetical protein
MCSTETTSLRLSTRSITRRHSGQAKAPCNPGTQVSRCAPYNRNRASTFDAMSDARHLTAARSAASGAHGRATRILCSSQSRAVRITPALGGGNGPGWWRAARRLQRVLDSPMVARRRTSPRPRPITPTPSWALAGDARCARGHPTTGQTRRRDESAAPVSVPGRILDSRYAQRLRRRGPGARTARPDG